MTTRPQSRLANQLREISITTSVNPHAEGSCLIKCGLTEVLCTASIQNKVPLWMKGKKSGWLTAEYGMLPRATGDRKDREATRGKQDGRTVEIQRLIGRSMRNACDLSALDGMTIWLDCDVLVADGGTRTTSITGAWVALALALKTLENGKGTKASPLIHQIAAISCGLSNDGVLVDLDYVEDSTILADANFIMDSNGRWIEVQMSSERGAVGESEFGEMQRLAREAIEQLFVLQRAAVEGA